MFTYAVGFGLLIFHFCFCLSGFLLCFLPLQKGNDLVGAVLNRILDRLRILHRSVVGIHSLLPFGVKVRSLLLEFRLLLRDLLLQGGLLLLQLLLTCLRGLMLLLHGGLLLLDLLLLQNNRRIVGC